MTRHAQFLILGAGPAGLAVGYALEGRATLLEREARPGGLCRSITEDGGIFDLGGHSFHTPYPEIRSLVETLLGNRMTYQRRQARVYVSNQLIDYPFQQSFRNLADQSAAAACEAIPSETVRVRIGRIFFIRSPAFWLQKYASSSRFFKLFLPESALRGLGFFLLRTEPEFAAGKVN